MARGNASIGDKVKLVAAPGYALPGGRRVGDIAVVYDIRITGSYGVKWDKDGYKDSWGYDPRRFELLEGPW